MTFPASCVVAARTQQAIRYSLESFIASPINCISEVQLSPYTGARADTRALRPAAWCPSSPAHQGRTKQLLGSAHKTQAVRLLLDRKSFGEDEESMSCWTQIFHLALKRVQSKAGERRREIESAKRGFTARAGAERARSWDVFVPGEDSTP